VAGTVSTKGNELALEHGLTIRIQDAGRSKTPASSVRFVVGCRQVSPSPSRTYPAAMRRLDALCSSIVGPFRSPHRPDRSTDAKRKG
jgi:hypothetical protein